MRPALLPRLVIPDRRSATPVLLASYPQQFARASSNYDYGPAIHDARVRPQRHQPQTKLDLDDMDDISLFNFYHPCLLPPSPVRTASTQPAEPPAGLQPERKVSLIKPPRRSSKRLARQQQQRRDTGAAAADPLRLLPSMPEEEPPLESQPQARRRVALPRWDGPGSTAGAEPPLTPSTTPSPDSDYEWWCDDDDDDDDDDNDGHHHDGDDDDKPRTSAWNLAVDEDHLQEQLALRELWGVVDSLLGPGAGREEQDAAARSSGMEGPGKGAGAWDGEVRGVGASDGYGTEMEKPTAWWRRVRKSLLLS